MAGAAPESGKDKTSNLPAPEVLKPQDETSPAAASEPVVTHTDKRSRRGSYRPSHKATFVALAVVVAILAVNAGIIAFVLRAQSKTVKQATQGQVSLSEDTLNKLGVNRSAVGNKGVELRVNPDAVFAGSVQIGGALSVGGALQLNGAFSASNANLAQLQAGHTSLNDLTVNGDGTVTNMNVNSSLVVAGITRLQGPVVASQLMTVNNSMNVIGNLSVGGTLAINTLHVSTLVVDSGITFGGHVVTQGVAPGVSAGGAVGSNGTVTVSGNDAAGTVAVNIGVGASGGVLASVTFRNAYSNTPHVVVSPIGAPVGNFYVNRTSSGFSISVTSGLSPGGYAFDYIVEQ